MARIAAPVPRQVALSASRRAVLLGPAPPLEPPYDDQLAPQTWLPAQLALDLSGDPARAPRSPTPTASLTEARSAPAQPRPASPALPVEAIAGASRESNAAAHRFLGMCLEIFNGYRPAAHVRPLVDPPHAAAIAEHFLEAGRRFGVPGPQRAARRGCPAAPPVQARRLRVCEPRPGVAEAAAVLGAAGRSWALAFRVERRRGTWLCTAAAVV